MASMRIRVPNPIQRSHKRHFSLESTIPTRILPTSMSYLLPCPYDVDKRGDGGDGEAQWWPKLDSNDSGFAKLSV